MKFFLDTADLEELRQAVRLGILDGVTTNPSLLAGVEADSVEHLLAIAALVDGPVNAEVIATDARGMVEEGLELADLAENIVVKIPMTAAGMEAVYALEGQHDVRTNVTLIFSPAQALVAAKAGASYVSPFLGRLDDIGHEGMDVVASTVYIYEQYGLATEVLAASIRHPQHVIRAAELGADIATMPYSTFEKLLKHPLTDIGLAKFLSDWEAAQGGG